VSGDWSTSHRIGVIVVCCGTATLRKGTTLQQRTNCSAYSALGWKRRTGRFLHIDTGAVVGYEVLTGAGWLKRRSARTEVINFVCERDHPSLQLKVAEEA
jgi:hypothetical protein